MKKMFLALMTLTIMVLIGTPQITNAHTPHSHDTHMTDIGQTTTAPATDLQIVRNYNHLPQIYLQLMPLNTDNTPMAMLPKRTQLPQLFYKNSLQSKYINSNPVYACINCLTNSQNSRSRLHLMQHQKTV